ncbi:unnamed protein product [Pocillopora meandrina]|uniref:Sushi domain-containing protein n=1 Tax=Pocillopora meandrina TaxID=46732 RepID=A0AAU9X4I6_9CNID|nr:unnamed protein product [Pocillopora meandrina]
MRHSCNSPCLLVADLDRVLALDYDNKSMFPVVSNLSFAVDVDFHYNKGYIFWCDSEGIQRSNMDGTNITVIHNDKYCYGLAVEWDSLQLYWTDYYNKSIMVSDLDGNNKRIVFSSLSRPTDIVLDPHQGLMFWIDTGNISKVERSTLYGTQHVTIAVHNDTYSTGITLDRRRKLIFWLSQWNLIESIDYSGNNRRKVFQSDGLYFFGLTFISSDLFAINRWLSGSVYRLNTSDGKVKSNVTVTIYWGGFYGLVAYDSSLQLPVITCPVPSPSSGTRAICPRNATVHHNAVYYNTTCQFSCKDGYVGSGSQVRRCQRNGTWSGQNYSCQKITCPVLSPPTHGTRYGCPGNVPLYNGTVCRFTCNNGYVGSGSQVRRCQYDGTWSGQNFVCKTLKCPTLSLLRNGVLFGCNTNNTEMLYDTECRFFCKEGSEAIGATIKRCAENGTWIGPDLVCPGTRDANYWYYQNVMEFKWFSLIFTCCIHCVA